MKWISEIGSNHNGDWTRLETLIKTSKDVGADAIKLQMFDERLGRTQEQKEIFKKNALPEVFLARTYLLCKELKLEFHCTPFHPDFVPVLDTYVDGFKIGSYELLWLDLIKACAATRVPIAISCGGGTQDEIINAYNAAKWSLPEELISMYACSPFYPSPTDELHTISELQREFPQSFIGYSDHTHLVHVMKSAIALGAKEIEFHLDLDDKHGREAAYGHCWYPSEIKKVIDYSKKYVPFDMGDNNMFVMAYETMRSQRTNPKDGMRGIID